MYFRRRVYLGLRVRASRWNAHFEYNTIKSQQRACVRACVYKVIGAGGNGIGALTTPCAAR